jgi:hypothetical protein
MRKTANNAYGKHVNPTGVPSLLVVIVTFHYTRSTFPALLLNAVVGISPSYIIISFKWLTEQTSRTTAADTIGDLPTTLINAYERLWSTGIRIPVSFYVWLRRSTMETSSGKCIRLF